MNAKEAIEFLSSSVADFEITIEQCHEIAQIIKKMACCGNCKYYRMVGSYGQCTRGVERIMGYLSHDVGGDDKCENWQGVDFD